MKPKVSIIIPVYNVESYLRECMDSVISQTLQEIEILCINDGSKDHSLAILQEYAGRDPRITVIDKQNEGYGIGMNLGLDRASGEYIGIVEPDDFVPPDMFGSLYCTAAENDLDFIKADFYRFIVGKDGEYNKTLFKLSRNPEDYKKVFDPGSDPAALRFVMNTWCGIYKRSFLNEHHIRHNTTPGASFQDTGFWFQTFVFGHRAMLMDTPFYMNRRDNPNSSVYDTKKIFTMNEEFVFIREIITKDKNIWERFKTMFWYIKYQAYMPRYQRIAPQFRNEFARRMSEEFRQGMDAGEIDLNLFTPHEQSLITTLLKSPKLFCIRCAIAEKKLLLRSGAVKAFLRHQNN